MEKTYSIGQVCEIFNESIPNQRYLEKAIGLKIKRNELNEREYSDSDIKTLEFVYEMKKKGLNNAAIKKILETQEEVAAEKAEELKNDLVLQNENMDKFLQLITDRVQQTFDDKLQEFKKDFEKEFQVLKEQNLELKNALMLEQEKHFSEVDEKLSRWREEQSQKKNSSFFSKLFK